MKYFKVIIGSTIIIVVIAVVAIRFSGPEDSWVCVSGKWVRHGNPSVLSPNSGCGDPKNISYEIEGERVILVNGKNETEVAPGSIVTTEFFGNEAVGDLNGDGREDRAFLVAVYGGGTGVFYYAVAALNKVEGYVGTDAQILGDRISPQTTEIKDGKIIVNFADRKNDEPMIAEPSVGVTRKFEVKNDRLILLN